MSVAFSIFGSVLGIFASWYIAKKIAALWSAFSVEFDKRRDEKLLEEKKKHLQDIQDAIDKTRKNIDDYFKP